MDIHSIYLFCDFDTFKVAQSVQSAKDSPYCFADPVEDPYMAIVFVQTNELLLQTVHT